MKGKTVTGTILMSTLQTFEDTPVAVINVRNKKRAYCKNLIIKPIKRLPSHACTHRKQFKFVVPYAKKKSIHYTVKKKTTSI